jgi:hypothetical protein
MAAPRWTMPMDLTLSAMRDWIQRKHDGLRNARGPSLRKNE